MNDKPDFNLDQNLTILTQAIKQATGSGSSDGMTFNVITASQIIIGSPPDKTDLAPSFNNENFIKIIELLNELPRPRLKNLERLAIAAALNGFNEDKTAADYLGVSTRVMSYQKNKKLS